MIPPVNMAVSGPYQPVREGTPYSRLRILHTNDIHEHWGEFAKTITGVKALSAQGTQQGEDVLRINAGDTSTGPEYPMWELGVRLSNLLGLHATTAGNHELLMNAGHYVTALKRWANFPTLLSNVQLSPNSIFRSLASSGHMQTTARIVQGQQGAYGLIGVATGRKRWKPAEDGGLRVDDFNKTCQDVEAQVEQLRARGINKIILVSHLGYKADQDLAQRVSGIDVIVGGDSHDAVHGLQPGKNVFMSPAGEPVVVLQAGSNGQYIGKLDMMFDQAGRVMPVQSELIPTAAFQPDPEATAIMDMYLPPEVPVATFLNNYDCHNRHTKPDPLAQMAADGLRAMSGADIAFITSGEIRKSISAGTITNREMKTVMAYMGPVDCIKLSGPELQSILNRSASGLTPGQKNKTMLLHASGLRYLIDPNTGTALNVTVWNKTTNEWEPLATDNTARYTVAMDDFLVKNKDGLYPEFATPNRLVRQIPMTVRDALVWSLQQFGAPYKPIVLPPADDRLTILPKTPMPEVHA